MHLSDEVLEERATLVHSIQHSLAVKMNEVEVYRALTKFSAEHQATSVLDVAKLSRAWIQLKEIQSHVEQIRGDVRSVCFSDLSPATVLVSLACLAFIKPKALALIRSQYLRKANEPPLESGLIPYLGLALEYGKNPKSLLYKMRTQHGNCFTLVLAGQRIILSWIRPRSTESGRNATSW
ncbi:Cholesterol 7-alpha-monooxygenase [Podochytrium sp. JEL0797]|nr:Cholesterol 7-alpha-monooxygenase [Podochytrium sp. JEL0797]